MWYFNTSCHQSLSPVCFPADSKGFELCRHCARCTTQDGKLYCEQNFVHAWRELSFGEDIEAWQVIGLPFWLRLCGGRRVDRCMSFLDPKDIEKKEQERQARAAHRERILKEWKEGVIYG